MPQEASYNSIISVLSELKVAVNQLYVSLPERVVEYCLLIFPGFAALAIAIWGEALKKKLGRWRSNLEIKKEIVPITQRYKNGSKIICCRLAVENKGKDTAREVFADVMYIKEEGSLREDFISAPLNWTHLTEQRNIHPTQTCFLNLVQVELERNVPFLRLSTRGFGIRTLERLEKGETELKVVIFPADGEQKACVIRFSWDGTFDAPKFEKVKIL